MPFSWSPSFRLKEAIPPPQAEATIGLKQRNRRPAARMHAQPCAAKLRTVMDWEAVDRKEADEIVAVQI